jgi:cytochrome c oxidase subunit 2
LGEKYIAVGVVMTKGRVRSRGTLLARVALSALSLGGCDFSGPRSALDPAGPKAREQLELFMLTFWWGLAVWLIIMAALFYAMWRYRRRPNQEGEPSQIHGEARLEAAWTVAPAIILVIIAIPTVRLILGQEQRIEPTEADLHIIVTGYQWWWEFEYPELGITTANELHIPVGRRVLLTLRSEDVLHSFWAPNLSGKRDLIPNQDNQLWFSADKPGSYYGHCAELCLTGHAFMRFYVMAQPEEEFSNWVASFQNVGVQQVALQGGSAQIEQGKALFKTKGCANCHAIAGYAYGQDAPDLTNFGQRTSIAAGVINNTPENLHAWLRNPDTIKPGNYMPKLWADDDPNRDEEIGALVAYLESLGTRGTRQAEAQHGSR